MIKATDMRIGNILLFTEGGEIAVVKEIHSDGIKVDSGKELVWLEYDQMEPIPLTEDWLNRFGFVKHDDSEWIGEYWDCDSFAISFTNLGFNVYRFYSGLQKPPYLITEIKCVHQLQNLYHALTGHELTLTEKP